MIENFPVAGGLPSLLGSTAGTSLSPLVLGMAKMHIDEDDLELYALLGVVWHGAAAVEEHLLVCELCRDRLDLMDDYIELVRLALHLSRLQ